MGYLREANENRGHEGWLFVLYTVANGQDICVNDFDPPLELEYIRANGCYAIFQNASMVTGEFLPFWKRCLSRAEESLKHIGEEGERWELKKPGIDGKNGYFGMQK